MQKKACGGSLVTLSLEESGIAVCLKEPTIHRYKPSWYSVPVFSLTMFPWHVSLFFCFFFWCAIIIAMLYELCRLYCELHSCTIRGTYQVTQQQADSANVKTLLFCAVKVLATSCNADVLRKIMHAYNIHDRAHRTSRSSANKAVFFPPAFLGHTHSNCRNNQQS